MRAIYREARYVRSVAVFVVALLVAPTPLDPLTDTCGTDPNYLCERVFDWSNGNDVLSRLVDWLVDRPLTIVFVLIAALVVVRIARRAVDRLVRRVVSPTRTARRFSLPGFDGTPVADSAEEREREERLAIRRAARAASISAVLSSTLTVIVWSIAAMLVLGELGIDLAPLIAGAGIVGVALGFGAQSLVKDCISGLFMLMEDQYGIGDVVDLGEASGTVEQVALRTTVLRGVDGTVWHVPNGEVRRVGNKSQHWSTALIDIAVAYDADLGAVRDVMQQTADEVCSRDGVRGKILEPPTVLGVEVLGADGVTLRMTVTTAPGAQWAVQRALREALKSAFDDAAIDIPFPQRTVWLRNREA